MLRHLPMCLLAFCVFCGCASQPAPCSAGDAVMAAKALECRSHAKAECAGMPDNECPVVAECDAWVEARCGGAK